MRTRDLKSAARRMGREAGKAAASGTWDGNTSQETAKRVLKGLEEGDPIVLDAFCPPDLSGQYADDPTPRSLMDDLGLEETDPRYEWLESELCDEWDAGVNDAFWREVEKAYRAILA